MDPDLRDLIRKWKWEERIKAGETPKRRRLRRPLLYLDYEVRTPINELIQKRRFGLKQIKKKSFKEDSTCATCGKPTEDNKPFCLEHIESGFEPDYLAQLRSSVSGLIKTSEEVWDNFPSMGRCHGCKLPKDHKYRRAFNFRKLLDHVKSKHRIDPIRYFAPILSAKEINKHSSNYNGHSDDIYDLVNNFIAERPLPGKRKAKKKQFYKPRQIRQRVASEEEVWKSFPNIVVCQGCKLPEDHNYRRAFNFRKLLEHIKSEHRIDPIGFFAPILSANQIKRHSHNYSGHSDDLYDLVNNFIALDPPPIMHRNPRMRRPKFLYY